MIREGAPGDLDTVYDLSEGLTTDTYRLGEADILLGTGFAEERGIGEGDTVELLLPDGRTAEYTVAGIFDLGAAAANDRFAFLDAASGADALGQDDNEYSAIEIQMTDVFASTEVAGRLADDHEVWVVDAGVHRIVSRHRRLRRARLGHHPGAFDIASRSDRGNREWLTC